MLVKSKFGNIKDGDAELWELWVGGEDRFVFCVLRGGFERWMWGDTTANVTLGQNWHEQVLCVNELGLD